MEILKYILSSIIVISTPLIFVKILINPKFRNDKSKIIVAVLISLISSILIYKYTEGLLRSYLISLLSMMSVYNIYNISINKVIISIVIYMILIIIPDFLYLFGLIYVFKIPKDYCYSTLSGSLISNFVICAIMIIMTLFIKKYLCKIINKKIDLNPKILIFSILSLSSILIFFFDTIESFRVGTKIILYLISIFTFVCALIIVVYEESKNIKLQSKYDKLFTFMEMHEAELENERIIRHEHKNQLITIKSKIIDKDSNKSIIEYIDSIISDETNFKQEEYIKFQYLPFNGLKALLYFKVSDAKKKGIEVNINISPSIKESFLKKLTTKEFKELGMLLGIYIDNAIDASQESDKKILGIEIYDTNDGVEFIISNSYKGKIDESKVGNVHFSKKGKGRGYGLLLAKRILKSNNKFNCKKEITASLYIQSIIIKK